MHSRQRRFRDWKVRVYIYSAPCLPALPSTCGGVPLQSQWPPWLPHPSQRGSPKHLTAAPPYLRTRLSPFVPSCQADSASCCPVLSDHSRGMGVSRTRLIRQAVAGSCAIPNSTNQYGLTVQKGKGCVDRSSNFASSKVLLARAKQCLQLLI